MNNIINKSDRSAISVGWYKSELKDGAWGSEENKCKQYFSGSLPKKENQNNVLITGIGDWVKSYVFFVFWGFKMHAYSIGSS